MTSFGYASFFDEVDAVYLCAFGVACDESFLPSREEFHAGSSSFFRCEDEALSAEGLKVGDRWFGSVKGLMWSLI